MKQTILAAHKAVMAAQACLDSVQHSLLALLDAEKSATTEGQCDHPLDDRITLETMAGREQMCNRCGRNIT